MSAINLTWNTTDLDKLAPRLKRIAPVAVMRALNRSIASGKTVMVRAIAADLGLKQKDVRDQLVIKEASVDRLTAQLRASYKRIPLIAFNAKGPVPSRGRGRGVTARTATGRYPHAFIATVTSPRGGRHTGVFTRVTGAQRRGPKPNRSQLPIRELKMPSLGHVFEKYRPQGQARAEEQLVKNITHELRFALSQTA